MQPGEQCDDGNTNSGDGCSSTCQVEAPLEIEPNNSTAVATPIWPGYSTWKASISPVGDRDYFTFTLAAPGNVTLLTHDVDQPNVCTSDTVLHLLDHNGTQIVQDDDDGVDACSQVSPSLDPSTQNLPAGTYYVWVQQVNDNAAIPAYQLDLSIQ